MLSKVFTLFSLLSLGTAHFTLDFPKARGFEEDKEENFPCGGFDSVSSERTDFPIGGGPIQVNFGHTQTNLMVLLALGDNPGNNFSIVLLPQLAEEGPGDFCAGQVSIPSDLNITSGTPATIQVITNAHGSGGLYQCADVTLVDDSLSEDDYSANCKNGTGVKVTSENIQGLPNGTSDDSPSPTASGSGAPASASSTGLASHPTAVSWALGAIGVAGLALL